MLMLRRSSVLHGLKLCFLVPVVMMLTHCAVAKYPGQPGVRTNGFSQIEREFVDEDGLWTFEVVYDNSIGGAGHIATITKLYPGAKTFTSNARSNGHGSFYRHKYPYKGALIQAIYIAKTNQMIIPEGSKVLSIVDAKLSVNEIDDRNVNEEHIFKGDMPELPKMVDLENIKSDLAFMRAGELTRMGRLGYNLAAVRAGNHEFRFKNPVYIEASLYQQGLSTSLTSEQKSNVVYWFNDKFPTGYDGEITFELTNGTLLSRYVAVNTFQTLKAKNTSIKVSDDMYSVYLSVLNYADEEEPNSKKPIKPQ